MLTRKWTYKLIAALLAGRLFLSIVNICVDPYDVFGSNILTNSHATNERYVKIKHLLKNRHKYDSYIFGSSKANVLSPEMINKYLPDTHYYNLSMKNSSLFDYLLHLNYLIRNGFEVRNVILTIDLSLLSPEYFAAFRGEPLSLTPEHFPHPSVLKQSNISYYMRYLKKLAPKAVLGKIHKNIFMNSPNQLDIEKGVYRWNQQEKEIMVNHEKYILTEDSLHTNKVNRYLKISGESIDAISRFIKLCDTNNINLTIIILPQNYNVMNILAEAEYFSFLINLSKITQYWNFSGYHSLSTENKYFYDYQHFRPLIAEMIFDRIYNKNSTLPMDFGFLINQQTVIPHTIELSYQLRKANVMWK